jgi:putative glycerol-1-phosphate prenyltransferase
MNSKSYNYLLNTIQNKGAGFVLLLDPDKLSLEKIPSVIPRATEAGIDAFFIGGSFLMRENFNEYVRQIKKHTGDQPVIIFPGSLYQISPYADALLYISLISGRNPEHLIGNQAIAAPMLWKLGIEPVSCGYMLIESGRKTSAEFVSNSSPIPRDKPEIALAHALAAQYLGMKTVYLEAGSGAKISVPLEMISLVSDAINIPLFVGGGIRSPNEAADKVKAGANLIVIGNFFEKEDKFSLLNDFADAIHTKR